MKYADSQNTESILKIRLARLSLYTHCSCHASRDCLTPYFVPNVVIFTLTCLNR